MANYQATAGSDSLIGTTGPDNLIVNRASYVQAGDVYDGGDGADILWVTKGMMAIDMPGNIDFTATSILNTETLAFNYMMMLMPGQAIFSSSQFGTGLLPNALTVQGAWGDTDITVSIAAGDTSFDASAWTFPVSGGTSSGTVGGIPSGTETSVWGHYIYTGATTMMVTNGQDVGGNDTIHLNGSSGANIITGTIKNDTIDGGGGADTVIFSGNRSDYTVSEAGGVITVADNRPGAPNGTDMVSNVELFTFADGSLTAAQVVNPANLAPVQPTISSMTDGPPVGNPTWIVHGTAEAGSTVTIYRNNNGVITTVGTGVAGIDGMFAVQTTANQHGTRALYATSTDADGNVSSPSLLYYQGGHHSETISLVSPAALAGISVLDGWHQDTPPGDVLKFTTAATVVDADFTKVRDVESLSLTGDSSATLGALATAAGITGIITGAGNTSITGADGGVLSVNAAALAAGSTLTLNGAADFTVTGSDADTTIVGGDGNDTVTGAGGNDMIDGGAGTGDKVILTGLRSDYTITLDGIEFTVADNRAAPNDGTDTVKNVESFQFSNATYTAAQLLDIAPAVTITEGPAAGSNTNLTTATFSWTSDTGSGPAIDHYQYSIDGGATWTTTTEMSATVTGITDGAKSFLVQGVDADGNLSIAASRSWTVDTSVPYMATAMTDNLVGGTADDDFIINMQAHINTGDVFDGGAGQDTFWAGQGMMDYEEDFDFRAATFLNMEALAFNYMPMLMPGQAVFSSSQFGTGLIAQNLAVYGTWGDQDITVNLADGNSSFDASGWTFATMGGVSSGTTGGLPSGTDYVVWGRYVYTGPTNMMVTSGQEVGGNDTIHLNGSAGNNTITGTRVADIINGGGGSDRLIGGRGDDVYIVDAYDTVTERAGGGTDTIRSTSGYSLGNHEENLVLAGSRAIGGKGNDLANRITGNDAANAISGGGGSDVLDGAGGRDLLKGGLGADMLSGGAGRDQFVFTSKAHSSMGAADKIMDFARGDKIDVRLIDANASVRGNQAFQLDAAGDDSFAIGHIRQTMSGNKLILDFNTDADGASEMRIVLLDHGALKAGDFVL